MTTAVAVLASANLTMVAVMVVLPQHLHGHGHGLDRVGLVVAAHVAAMYVASPLIGRLTDRVGPARVATAGGSALVLVTVAVAATGVRTLPVAALATIALGVAWNAQLVAGSAALAAPGSPDEADHRALGEVGMNVAAAAGCLVVVGPGLALGGLPLVALVVGLVDVLVLGMLRRVRDEPGMSAPRTVLDAAATPRSSRRSR